MLTCSGDTRQAGRLLMRVLVCCSVISSALARESASDRVDRVTIGSTANVAFSTTCSAGLLTCRANTGSHGPPRLGRHVGRS